MANFALVAGWVATLYWAADWPPWLRTAHILAFVIATYGVSAAAQARADRRLDEVELAAARFGARWGLPGGVAFMTVLALLPPFQVVLAAIAGVFGRIEDDSMTGASRLFLLAIVTTFIAQETFRTVFAAAWKWSKR
jgi:hypothetical protein